LNLPSVILNRAVLGVVKDLLTGAASGL